VRLLSDIHGDDRPDQQQSGGVLANISNENTLGACRQTRSHTLASRFHQRGGVLGIAVIPLLEILCLRDDRHSVVYLGDKLAWFRDDHRARQQFVSGLLVPPDRPQASERDRLSVAPYELVRLPAACRLVPLVVSARGDRAAPPRERVAEHRLGGDGFRSGVESGEPRFSETPCPSIMTYPQDLSAAILFKIDTRSAIPPRPDAIGQKRREAINRDSFGLQFSSTHHHRRSCER
jgi:hypothetical protein